MLQPLTSTAHVVCFDPTREIYLLPVNDPPMPLPRGWYFHFGQSLNHGFWFRSSSSNASIACQATIGQAILLADYLGLPLHEWGNCLAAKHYCAYVKSTAELRSNYRAYMHRVPWYNMTR